MVGSGSEAGQLAVALDDALGKFTAKRRKDGRYEITVTSAAAVAGGFNLTFPPFERKARIVPMGTGPSVITFAAGDEFLSKVAA